MKTTLSKVLKKLNAPTPQDYAVGVKKDNPADTTEAYITISGPGRKLFSATAREKSLPLAYAVTMPMSEFKGLNLVQAGVLPTVD